MNMIYNSVMTFKIYGVEQVHETLQMIAHSSTENKIRSVFGLVKEGCHFEKNLFSTLERIICQFVEYGMKNTWIIQDDIPLIQKIARQTFQKESKDHLQQLSNLLAKEFFCNFRKLSTELTTSDRELLDPLLSPIFAQLNEKERNCLLDLFKIIAKNKWEKVCHLLQNPHILPLVKQEGNQEVFLAILFAFEQSSNLDLLTALYHEHSCHFPPSYHPALISAFGSLAQTSSEIQMSLNKWKLLSSQLKEDILQKIAPLFVSKKNTLQIIILKFSYFSEEEIKKPEKIIDAIQLFTHHLSCLVSALPRDRELEAAQICLLLIKAEKRFSLNLKKVLSLFPVHERFGVLMHDLKLLQGPDEGAWIAAIKTKYSHKAQAIESLFPKSFYTYLPQVIASLQQTYGPLEAQEMINKWESAPFFIKEYVLSEIDPFFNFKKNAIEIAILIIWDFGKKEIKDPENMIEMTNLLTHHFTFILGVIADSQELEGAKICLLLKKDKAFSEKLNCALSLFSKKKRFNVLNQQREILQKGQWNEWVQAIKNEHPKQARELNDLDSTIERRDQTPPVLDSLEEAFRPLLPESYRPYLTQVRNSLKQTYSPLQVQEMVGKWKILPCASKEDILSTLNYYLIDKQNTLEIAFLMVKYFDEATLEDVEEIEDAVELLDNHLVCILSALPRNRYLEGAKICLLLQNIDENFSASLIRILSLFPEEKRFDLLNQEKELLQKGWDGRNEWLRAVECKYSKKVLDQFFLKNRTIK